MRNKLQKAISSYPFTLLFFLSLPGVPATAQDSSYSRPPVISRYQAYKEQVKNNPLHEMVELKSLIPRLQYDLRYAGTHNFMKRRMYPSGTRKTFLRKPAAEALKKVADELAIAGLGVKIFDAYRPYSVTVKFWELVKDERFVAHPRNGSGHNRGVAVDLTLIRLANGEELDMGTGFDHFSDTAHQGFKHLPKEVLGNRVLLKTTMEKYGFKPYADEWWHYSWPEAAKFDILDIRFKKLSKDL